MLINPNFLIKDDNRFWSKVEKTDYCWNWKSVLDAGGYGQFKYNGKMVHTHRFVLKLIGVELIDGLQIDHLCRNRKCVNPTHLEQVTKRENILRGVSPSAIHAKKTHCPKGHDYTTENTYYYKRGGRQCKKCIIERSLNQYKNIKDSDKYKQRMRETQKRYYDRRKNDSRF